MKCLKNQNNDQKATREMQEKTYRQYTEMGKTPEYI
jgi:hypothetical protein